MTEEKFIYHLPERLPDWWINFYRHCTRVAWANKWLADTVIKYEMRPYGGRQIVTSTQGSYLRFDSESAFTMFVLRWA